MCSFLWRDPHRSCFGFPFPCALLRVGWVVWWDFRTQRFGRRHGAWACPWALAAGGGLGGVGVVVVGGAGIFYSCKFWVQLPAGFTFCISGLSAGFMHSTPNRPLYMFSSIMQLGQRTEGCLGDLVHPKAVPRCTMGNTAALRNTAALLNLRSA